MHAAIPSPPINEKTCVTSWMKSKRALGAQSARPRDYTETAASACRADPYTVERRDLAVEPIPIDPLGKLHQLMIQVDDLVDPRPEQIARARRNTLLRPHRSPSPSSTRRRRREPRKGGRSERATCPPTRVHVLCAFLVAGMRFSAQLMIRSSRAASFSSASAFSTRKS